MQAVEGYVENGQVFISGVLDRLQGRRRVIVTILDEPVSEFQKSNKSELLSQFNSMVEKSNHIELKLEDFPRFDFGRAPISFEEGGEN